MLVECVSCSLGSFLSDHFLSLSLYSRAIKTNQDLLPETPWTNIFYDDFWGTLLTHSGSHKSYRPLCTLSFRLNHAVGGLEPWGYHLVNVVLHGAVTGLFTSLARLLLGGGLWSLLAGLLFASHPIHTEAVAGVVGRADEGAALFFLLSLLCYIRHCRLRGRAGSWRLVAWFLGSLGCAACSMLWKELGVTVLAVSALYDVCVFHRLKLRQIVVLLYKRKNAHLLLNVFLLAAWGFFLLACRFYWMGNKPPNFSNSDNPAADSPSLITRTLTFFYLPAVNFWLLLCPDTLSFDWSMDAVPLIRSLADWRNFHTVVFYSGLLLLAWFGLWTHPWGNLGNVLKSQGKMEGAEQAYRNALYYRSNMADMLYNLGLLLQESNKFSEALHYYKLAIGSRPTLASAYLNTGIILMNQGRLDEAKRTFLTCADIPDENLKDPHAHKSSVTSCLYNLGKLLHEQGHQEYESDVFKQLQHPPKPLITPCAYIRLNKLTEAEFWYRESLRAKPDHIPAHLTYGKLLAMTGQKTEAERYFLKAIQLDPTKGNCYMHYGQFLLEESRLLEAAEMAKTAARLDSGEFDVVFNAAHMLRQASLNEAAEKYYGQAASLRPNYPAALMNLGAILHLNGKLQEAEANYLRALQLKPDDAITQSNLRKLWNIMEKQGLRTTSP
uniref:dolichyl-phosphate-mannose--protein mannosyltransferase n=1 Tax=Neolamprologus brichardi TaxID=32507 RepID=A0A3Q4MWE2_NEOBR